MAPFTKLVKTFKQLCNQIQKFWRYGKTSRLLAGMSSFAGLKTQNRQQRANAA